MVKQVQQDGSDMRRWLVRAPLLVNIPPNDGRHGERRQITADRHAIITPDGHMIPNDTEVPNDTKVSVGED